MSDPYDYPKKCICGNTTFFHLQEGNYDYCRECNAAYDEDGNLIPEGPEEANDE